MNVVSEDPARFSLRVICRSVLARQWLWAADGRAEGFREDLEQLLIDIDGLPGGTLKKNIWALNYLSAQMPEIRLSRGDLAGLVATIPDAHLDGR